MRKLILISIIIPFLVFGQEKNITKSIENKTEIKGGPDGDYYIIFYKSEFENKKNAIETITIKKSDDGSWKVAGYYIR